MDNPNTSNEIKMDASSLYREEVFTDNAVGTKEERFAIAVQAEAQRARVETIARNPAALILTGRVVDSQRLGIAKLTISAVDAKTGNAAASAVSSETGSMNSYRRRPPLWA